MTARRLVAWRHGRTEWNHEDRFQGQTDIALDEVGLAQAEAAAGWLAALRPAAIVASDLTRTTQTAAALARVTGLPVTYDSDLREIHVGSWAGMTRDEFIARHPDLQARLDAGEDVRRGGDGETMAEVAERAEKGFLRATELVADGETVVVTSHGLATRVGIARLVGLPPECWDVFGGLRNCAWAVCEQGKNGWRIVEWNAGPPSDPRSGDTR